jgi:outer membrane protein assembly factor BamD (BamD/ComL family)
VRRINAAALVLTLTLTGCASGGGVATIADLEKRKPEVVEPKADFSVDPAEVRQAYRDFLAINDEGPLYGEALRRLGDLELEAGEDRLSDNPAATQQQMQAAIRLYQTYLETYPGKPGNDKILYQLAKAYELQGRPNDSLRVLNRIMRDYPDTRYRTEVQFRRGEMYFVLRQYRAAQNAYASVVNGGKDGKFYEKALYKYGWARFKQNDYRQALDAFFTIMDRKQQQGMLAADGPAPGLGRTEKELLNDTLRAISLSFAYLYDDYSVAQYFDAHGDRPYEPLIYRNLAELHFEKERLKDAADTYMAYVKRNPTSPLAPQFHTEAIRVLEAGHFASLVLPAKEEFVRLYGVGSPYWQQQDEKAREKIKPLLSMHIQELATYYHAQARKSKKPADFQTAAHWYETYLKTFPDGEQAPKMNFLLAECLFDGGFYSRAVDAYERTAYHYSPHPNSNEAGYAALLTYAKLEQANQSDNLKYWRQRKIDSALRFSDHFPHDPRVPAVLSKTAEELYAMGDNLRAASTAQKLLAMQGLKDTKLKRTALVVLGHAQFEMKNYAQAEQAYTSGLRLIPKEDKQYRAIYDRLAASIYKQGEQARSEGKLAAAVSHFMRVTRTVPASSMSATAQYDAATTLIEMKDYQRAGPILEDFRRRYPDNKLQAGIGAKLALVYTETGQSGRAAREMEAMAGAKGGDTEYRRNLMWQAATLYEKSNQTQNAIRVYNKYIQSFPHPLEQAVEARHKLAEYARKQGDNRQWSKWLQSIIQAHQNGGSERTDRTRFLAAQATVTLARGHRNAYQQARLTHPLKQSLKKKKRLMQNTIKAYQAAIQYRVAEVTTDATYQIAEVYRDFAKSLLNSDRPKGLSDEEKLQYEVLLEEQAYPFEEKAIDIHAENVKQIRDGIYDEWVKKSLAALRKLQPVRYAKSEKIEGYVETLQ